MYKKVLIATDGSELAGKAVDHGVRLAKASGASVVIVTVTEYWSGLDMARDFERGHLNPIEHYEAMESQLSNDILAGAKRVAEKYGVDCKMVHVKDSAPAEGIINVANENSSDLIVMASHGRRGVGRMLIGSQTSEVIAFSMVPVLVLR